MGRTGREYHLLDADEIVAFQAHRELVWVITAQQRFLATQTLRLIEERLKDPQFERVHRNAIVNVNHVRKMSAMTSHRWLVSLSNGLQIVVSKRQAHNIRRILHRHMCEIGRKGGKIGGKRSLETMTPEERSARAKKASEAAAKKRTADRLAREAAAKKRARQP